MTKELKDIKRTLKDSVSIIDNVIDQKEVETTSLEVDYTPSTDRTYIMMWITFTDGNEMSFPVGWYQGEPSEEITEKYADGHIVGIFTNIASNK